METTKISKKLLNRLPMYLAHIKSLPENSNVSATAIAKHLDLGEVQVRKDLAKISQAGRCRTGRLREQLIQDIEGYLDFDTETRAVIVGSGKLGCALLDYTGFEDWGLQVMAGFDLHPATKQSESGKPIYPMAMLEPFCKQAGVHIGVVAVPAQNAQQVCDTLVDCGITAIWNFAPVHLNVPDHVVVQNENLAISLTVLRMQMKN